MARIFNVLYLAVMAGTAVYANAADYCKTPCNSEIHTMCLYKSPEPAPACKEAHSIGLTNAEKDIIVKKHNQLRQKVASGKEKRGKPGPQPAAVKMPDLTWDDELETIAQRLANQCIFAHDKCRNVERFPVGQNIHIASAIGQEPSNLEEMIQDWYDEVASFDKKIVSSFKKTPRKTGHYTQIVWADTTKIGCGRIKYKNEENWDTILLVCNYGPCGNRIGDKIYEIKK